MTSLPRAALLGPLAIVCSALVPRSAGAQVSGVVIDEMTLEPLAGAEVRVRAEPSGATTDANGAFDLAAPAGLELHVVAGMPGYYNAGAVVTTPKSNLVLVMPAVPQDDAASYAFLEPAVCAFCHPNQLVGWQKSPMAHAGLNTWVYDAYDGTGTPGGMGGFVYTRDSVLAPKNPASECRSCHQPEPWVAAPFTALGDIKNPTPGMLHGVSCDICHKIAHIDESKPSFPGIWPGVVTLTRPAGMSPNEVEYGPLPDVDYSNPKLMRASFQPQLAAAVCAACHQDKNDPDQNGNFEEPNGVISEPTYLEWKSSPYGDPASPSYRTCADCHMPPFGTTHVCEILVPPIVRAPDQIRAHTFRGTTPEYLEKAVSMKLGASRNGDTLVADVAITNDQTGHSVPTGVTVRNAILVMEAWREQDMVPLVHTGAQIVDALGGVGDPQQGYWQGLPGKVYAKRSFDVNGDGPVFFTEATGILWDTRIAAFATDATSYPFQLPAGGGKVHVRARLVYRRAFRSLVDAKGWTTTGHGEPLEDIAAPDYGHVMASSEKVFDLDCDAGLCEVGNLPDAGPGGGGGAGGASGAGGMGGQGGGQGGHGGAGGHGGNGGNAGNGGNGGNAGNGGAAAGGAPVDAGRGGAPPGEQRFVALGGCDCNVATPRPDSRAGWALGLCLASLLAARRRRSALRE